MLTAVVAGHVREVRRMASYKRALFARHPVGGATVLHLAVIFERLGVLRLLLRMVDPALYDALDYV